MMTESMTISSAPWKVLLAEHIKQASQDGLSKPPEFQLATVDPAGQPRVRTLYHRGFWGEHADSSSSPDQAVYESDCPIFITGARSNKACDIYTAGLDHCTTQTLSGGGGQVEILYWFRRLGVQWRIRGRCWLMSSEDPGDQDGLAHNDRGVELARQNIHVYMRPMSVHGKGSIEKAQAKVIKSLEGGKWSWNKEVKSYVVALDSEERSGFEKVGFRVGVLLPEAVELRDMTKNSKDLWALSKVDMHNNNGEREWLAIKAWP